MGIIKAVAGAAGGGLADQWLEVIEAEEMEEGVVFTKGVKVRQDDKRSSNKKGTEDFISNGSVVHVYPNQFMMLVDGGKIIDYTAEAGYYTVKDSSAPSLFNGELSDTLKESLNRIKFGGVSPKKQKVFFINLQEIKGIKFGTRTPVNYFDNFYNAELFLRAHGSYSIKITDPILFYAEAIPKNEDSVHINDINDQYLAEFLEALQAAINQMSADGQRISFVTSKGHELSKYMAQTLDEEWKVNRGMEIQSVGIAAISYDEESTKLINMRNQGAMMSNPGIREGFVQSSVAAGMQAAGSNPNGAGAAFMGMGMGMNAAGGFMGAASNTNMQQMQMQQPYQQQPYQQQTQQPYQQQTQQPYQQQTQQPYQQQMPQGGNTASSVSRTDLQGAGIAAGSWICTCGASNTGKFCSECGSKNPAARKVKCDKCGYEPNMNTPIPKFCPECGDPINAADMQ